MGEALITRRGSTSGRVASGIKENMSTNTFSVSGLNFQPKNVKLFLKGFTGNPSTHQVRFLFARSAGLYDAWIDGVNLSSNKFSVEIRPDGFTIKEPDSFFPFNGNYYWIAFEKEQEV